MIINLLDTFNKLQFSKSRIFYTAPAIEMMNLLDQKYRRSQSSVYWFQLFLNGAWLENKFKQINPGLSYIEDNHGILDSANPKGHFIPDFKFSYSGLECKIDTKTFLSLTKFNNCERKDFNDADYIIAFIMLEKRFYVRKRLSYDQYAPAVPVSSARLFDKPMTQLINFPKQVIMINLTVKSETPDSSTPESVRYWINPYNVVD